MKRRGNPTVKAVWMVVAAGIITGAHAKRVKADFTFGEPTNLGPTVNSSVRDQRASISSDGLELYFHSERHGGLGDHDLYLTTRSALDEPWGEPVNLGPPVNTSDREGGPRLSADDLSLLFHSNRPGGSGGTDLHIATRPSKNDAWGVPANLGPTVNSSANDAGASISADGVELYFHSSRSGGLGGADLYVATRLTIHDDWGEPMNLGSPVNTSDYDYSPNISSDRLTLFFYSTRPGGYGSTDIWMARRITIDAVWGEPVNLGPIINSSSRDNAPAFSADGSMLYFYSDRAGGFGDFDLWQAPVIPIVDFNGDGAVDAVDIDIMIDYWGTDEPLCDIGPMPWGDGVVDVEDLKVLARYIGEVVDDPTLVAHWALDETEGIIAYDMGGTCDGAVIGTPLWHPDDGKIDGALELDGSTVVAMDHVVSPADGPFSVLAWIKTDVSGQVVISQADGANWLCTDPMDGSLMTELKGAGRDSCTLCSETVITDGSWHRIALVWDGDARSLYVDDLLAAQDTQAGGPAKCSGGLNIGCDRNMTPATFFTGLIDDIRLYNRAVKP
ncbi:MAG: LamG-like jellyroll fold domain-containing protein [Planctomycetota bacterium]|jgi:hypothetical protein